MSYGKTPQPVYIVDKPKPRPEDYGNGFGFFGFIFAPFIARHVFHVDDQIIFYTCLQGTFCYAFGRALNWYCHRKIKLRKKLKTVD